MLKKIKAIFLVGLLSLSLVNTNQINCENSLKSMISTKVLDFIKSNEQIEPYLAGIGVTLFICGIVDKLTTPRNELEADVARLKYGLTFNPKPKFISGGFFMALAAITKIIRNNYC